MACLCPDSRVPGAIHTPTHGVIEGAQNLRFRNRDGDADHCYHCHHLRVTQPVSNVPTGAAVSLLEKRPARACRAAGGFDSATGRTDFARASAIGAPEGDARIGVGVRAGTNAGA